MDLKTYLDSLTNSEREAFAQRAGNSLGYLRHITDGRKPPSTIRLIVKLIKASDGNLTLEGLRPDLFDSRTRSGSMALETIRKGCRKLAARNRSGADDNYKRMRAEKVKRNSKREAAA